MDYGKMREALADVAAHDLAVAGRPEALLEQTDDSAFAVFDLDPADVT